MTSPEDHGAPRRETDSVRRSQSLKLFKSKPQENFFSPLNSSEVQDQWGKLIAEPFEVVEIDGSQVDGSAVPCEKTKTASSPPVDSVPAGDERIVRNLDTGEVRDLLEEGNSADFFGQWEDPQKLKKRTPAWYGWWQQHRKANEELCTASEQGDEEKIHQLLDLDPGVVSEARSMPQPLMEEDEAEEGEGGDREKRTAQSFVTTTTAASVAMVYDEQKLVRPSVNARTLKGRTALHLAAWGGHEMCIEALLKGGALVNVQNDTGFTPLHVACERGHLGASWALLHARCDTAIRTERGDSALHLAAAKGHTDVLAFLLEHCQYLLLARNQSGQRPVEVSKDIATVKVFAKAENSAPATPSNEDTYRRIPFEVGGVLLRNSRWDAVRRLIEGAGLPPGGDAGSTGGSIGYASDGGETGPSFDGRRSRSVDVRRARSPGAELSRSRSSRSLRPSFSALRQVDFEVVGPDSFQLLSMLGKGSFGEVYHVTHKTTGEVYAMKVLKKNKIISRNLVRYAMTERNLLSYIRHPFIVRLHFAFQTPTCLVLVLQFCSNGNLASLISKHKLLPENISVLYLSEVFLAIEHLHERHVVYRDLKPENIVHDDDMHAMLTDFGLSKEGVEGLNGTKSFCGSIAYIAPEILAKTGHGPPVDLYGLGVLHYEMLTGSPPFYSRDRDTLFRNIATKPLNVPDVVGQRSASLIRMLMARDPAQRLGAQRTSDIRSHAIFDSTDFEAVLRRNVRPPKMPPRREMPTASKPAQNGKLTNPFEGRRDARKSKTFSSNPQEVSGWEFAAASFPEKQDHGSMVQSPDTVPSSRIGRIRSRPSMQEPPMPAFF